MTLTATPAEIISTLAAHGIDASLDEMGGGVGAVRVPVVLHPVGEVEVLIGSGDWGYRDMDRPASDITVGAYDFDGAVTFVGADDPDEGRAVNDMDDLVDAVMAAMDALEARNETEEI